MAIGTLHEDLRRDDRTSGPSDRKFGLTVGGILALIAVVKSLRAIDWGRLGACWQLR